MEEANGDRDEVVARALGEAQRFNLLVEQYALAPEVMRERLYIETMQAVLSNTSKVLVSGGEGNNNLLYLPLDRLMQQGGVPGNPSSAGVQGGTTVDSAAARLPTQLPQRDARSRETR
jgi:modulator of FtsH protease HflK